MTTQDFIAELVAVRNCVAYAEDRMHKLRFELEQANGQLEIAHATIETLVAIINRIGVEVITLDDDGKRP